MKKPVSDTAAALTDFILPVVPVSPVKPPYSMKPVKLPDWRANVRPEGLLYRNEPSLMGATRKLPSGEIV